MIMETIYMLVHDINVIQFCCFLLYFSLLTVLVSMSVHFVFHILYRIKNNLNLNLLEQGIIEETNSLWAVLILMVAKPDGTGRLCVDYRKLNNLTEPDPFSMPRIDAYWIGWVSPRS